MKVELNLNHNGHPVIEFSHFAKSTLLEEQILGVFIEMAQKNGIKLVNTGGFASTDKPGYDNYQITAE